MNIEQKLEVIRKALEMGAEVDLFINGNDKNRMQAFENMKELAELLNCEVISKNWNESVWWAIRTDEIRVSHHYRESYMIEDINFEGVEEHA